jgi:nucleolar MIF4G domain-containing protein 1
MEPLRVSLQDFVDADTRGKWWLVGAAWAGNPLVETKHRGPKAKSFKPAVEDEEVLLEAARGQGMNTDVRRSVFVILMSSEVSSCAIYRLRRIISTLATVCPY